MPCFLFSFGRCIVQGRCLRRFLRLGREFFPLHILHRVWRCFSGRVVLRVWFSFRGQFYLLGFRYGTWWFFWLRRFCQYWAILKGRLLRSCLIRFFWWSGTLWRNLCVCTSWWAPFPIVNVLTIRICKKTIILLKIRDFGLPWCLRLLFLVWYRSWVRWESFVSRWVRIPYRVWTW